MRLAIVGGGWAGLAAAVRAVGAGHEVTLFEAARTLGGRARSLQVDIPGAGTVLLDNGQHIMIGAYVETLRMMQAVGVEPAEVLHALPLALRFPDGGGLALPPWPAPWDAAAGILTAKGWSARDKWSLLCAAAGWQLRGFACAADVSVAALCAGLTPRVRKELVEPLCVSALNTPADRASAQVFLRVIRDSLFGRGHGAWGGSTLLLPRQALGALFPEAAQHWLQGCGAQVRLGHRVHALAASPQGCRVDAEEFDAAILACPPWEAARLVDAGAAATHWTAQVHALAHEPIATVYATGGPTLPLPLLALHSDAQRPAQFVFDRAQLGGPPGLLAFVVSACQGEREMLQHQVMAQASQLGWDLQPVLTVVEKRATFACVPGMSRPSLQVGPRLWACGDYVQGPYPATIEGAVRSALQAVQALSALS